MYKVRVIARLDVKNDFVIKGINLEGLRKIGDPIELAKKYYDAGIDEIVFMDSVASLYDRNNLFHIIKKACKEIFIPITIGGGIRSVDDISMALRSGADKITLNTQAIKNPEIITEASQIFGSQCIVGSIEAKRKGNTWEAYVNNGRESTGVDAVEWASKLEQLGIGELLITAVDQEGTKRGFDIELVEAISKRVSIPIIVSGGAGKTSHIVDLFKQTNVNAVAIASLLHYNLTTVQDIKAEMLKNEIVTRK